MSQKKIFSGVIWAGIESFFTIGFRFLVMLLLAKQLSPSDFGLVGMSSVFIVVVTAISELGMGAALIQKQTDGQAERLYDTSFWTGMMVGCCLYLTMSFVLAPLIANFYNEQRLVIIIPVLCLPILIKPINLINLVILTRKMDFKTMALYNNASVFIAGTIALILAYLNFGVWALIVFNILAVLLPIPFFFAKTKWKPNKVWKKQHFLEVFKFGIFYTGASFLSATTYNLDNLMIGKMLGASTLGAYTLAFSFTEVLRQRISAVLNRVMYPVFGQNQDDIILVKQYFLVIIKTNALVVYPLMSCFFIFADDIVIALFGDEWQEVIVPLKGLSIAVMIHLTVNSFTSLLRGLGFPKMEFQILLVLTTLVLVPGLYIGILNWGIVGAVGAIILSKITLVFIAVIVLRYKINLTVVELFHTLKGIVFAMLISYSLVVSLEVFSDMSAFFSLSIYLVVCLLLAILFEQQFLKKMVIGVKKR